MRSTIKFNKIFFSVVIIVGLMFASAITHAQELPCDGNVEPTSGATICPLDTNVWVLVVLAAIFGVVYLKRRQNIQAGA